MDDSDPQAATDEPVDDGLPVEPVQYPSPGRRLAARMIDWAIHYLIILVVLTVLGTTSVADDLSLAAWGTIFFGATALLRGVFEISFVGANGATPGKMIMNLRVRKGSSPSRSAGWAAATVRGVLIDLPTLFGGLYYIVLIAAPGMDATVFALWTILWAATWVFWLVEVLSIFNNPSRLGLHDRLAKTVVAAA